MDSGKETLRDDTAPPEKEGEAAAALDEAETARREALKRLGILASYTAPAMMVLLSNKVQAQSATSGATN
jgi:hypothetical protein